MPSVAEERQSTRSLHSRNPKTERPRLRLEGSAGSAGGHGLAFEGKPLDIYSSMAENNKLVKTITDAATITGLATGMGYLAKKVLKEQFYWRPVGERQELRQDDCGGGHQSRSQRLSRGQENYPRGDVTPAVPAEPSRCSLAPDTPFSVLNLRAGLEKMASIAIMVEGAVLNATSFIGGNYLTHYLSGNDPGKAQAERDLQNKALEKVKRFREGQERLRDFIVQNDRLKHQASQNLVNVDEALKLYNQTHQGSQLPATEPKFSDLYRPNFTTKDRRDGVCWWWSARIRIRCQPLPLRVTGLFIHFKLFLRAVSTSRFSYLGRFVFPKVYHRASISSPRANEVFLLTVAAVKDLYELLKYISSLDATGYDPGC